MNKINFLPPWVETNLQPAFYDSESGTCLQQTARMYAKVNQLVRSVNDQNETIDDYIQQFIDLKDYVEDYFDNLDVQEEINNKLEQMADSGELGEIISSYVQPILAEFEEDVNNHLATQDADIIAIDNKVTGLSNGSPIPVSSTDDMTDTDRVYVLVSTGKWYYYDGDSWEIGGDYQTPVADFDTTLTEKDGIPDSKAIGDRINSNFYCNNIVDKNDCQINKHYNGSGNIVSYTDGIIYNRVIPVKSGDTIYGGVISNGTITSKTFTDIIEVDCYGNFIQKTTVNASYYVIQNDGYIRVCVNLVSPQTINDIFIYKNYPTINYADSSFINANTEEINAINKDLDNNSVQYNYLDVSKCIVNQNMNSTGNITYSSNGYFVTNMIPVKSGDVVRFYNFNAGNTYAMTQVCKYDTNKQFVARTTGLNNLYTADADGYIIANCTKPTAVTQLDNLDITINRQITTHHPYGRMFDYETLKGVRIIKQDSNNFTIHYGNFTVTLFKTVNAGTNANNWNLKEIKKGANTLVPAGTDIIGPVRINENSDFIGGVHGDEVTEHIIIDCNGITYKDSDIQNISDISTDRLTITLISSVYDQVVGDKAFDRNVIINITNNKIHVSNSFVATKGLTLKVACTGGLIACHNDIIKDITINSNYISSAPTTDNYPQRKENTYAIFHTNYGTIQATNLKGHENANYKGWLKVYTNETPMRSKVYFNTYNYGNYSIVPGDVIDGEFEYIFD